MLSDHIAQPYQIVRRLRPVDATGWQETQAKLEYLAVKYFQRLLPSAKILTNVHYRGQAL